MMIFVFVFLIADISTALGDWSAITNPSPYVLISAIAFAIISTDFPATLPPSSTDTAAFARSRLCASSKTVICLSFALDSSENAILCSDRRITRIPINKAFVSCDPTLLRSTTTLESNKTELSTSLAENSIPFKPFVRDFTLVSSAPL